MKEHRKKGAVDFTLRARRMDECSDLDTGDGLSLAWKRRNRRRQRPRIAARTSDAESCRGFEFGNRLYKKKHATGAETGGVSYHTLPVWSRACTVSNDLAIDGLQEQITGVT